jgi:hypothetical protein
MSEFAFAFSDFCLCVCIQQGRYITHKFESGWEVGGIKAFDEGPSRWKVQRVFRFHSTTPSSLRLLLLNGCTCTDPHVPPTNKLLFILRFAQDTVLCSYFAPRMGTKNDGCGQKSEGDDGFVGTIKVLQATQSCRHLGYWATPKAMPDSHHPKDAKQGGKSERTGKNQCTTSLQGTWGSGDPGKRHGNCGRSGLREGETGCRI